MLDATTIEGFTGSILASRFDSPTPIPDFHRELWELCTLEDKKVAVAAPRGHAKSTGVTLSYLLASVLFREATYAIIVSDTEGQASQFLGDLKVELLENEALIENFGKSTLLKDTETKLIVQMEDGHQFRSELMLFFHQSCLKSAPAGGGAVLPAGMLKVIMVLRVREER